MQHNNLQEQMSGLAGGMVLRASFSVIVTGWQHSPSLKEGRIVADETVLFAFRERGRSSKKGRAYEVRRDDEDAVVLCLRDHDPADRETTQQERDQFHGGYLGYGTAGRATVVALMDRWDVGPHVKIKGPRGSCPAWPSPEQGPSS